MPRSTTSSQEEQPASEVQQVTESRANAQQPTPPADVPLNQSSSASQSLKNTRANMQEDKSLAYAQHELQKKKQSERRISNLVKRNQKRREEEDEDEEKALSDCDDDEWARRYPTVMERNNNPIPLIPKRISDYQKWIPGSSAMFAIRDTGDTNTAVRNNLTCLSSSG